ncbi:XRE family transcriptional regulator [Streptococcus anginosus]|uniref:XRE family transcriptional regulator n=1 Tax=Streptococcus anginosus TaxID=1328 RepID=A0AAW5TEW2_STRAP|nr:XRE family transcriptional regulator [Streptococcus anginosus]MCW1053179.1 XRE family transcriptional regulator [Streptococcus anginosus]MCW1071484.1 XRE family transcriptional regulator [Streptococcus anginosus]MED5793814.1 XRE family transcriptional regulator [Streptococcus anginosus]MED5795776.1 XRE family transcriptional regulator [Streptococcus anginosus]MED5885452.1 XRE family transcriptional regulator [Streptococcus anginosus]
MSALSENIRKYRKEKKLTQKELARTLKVAPTAVSAWELGRNKPLMDNVERMVDIFGVKKSELLGDTLKELTSSPSEIQSLYDKLYPPRQGKVLNFAREQLDEQEREDYNSTIIPIHTELQEPNIEYKVYEKLSAGDGYEYLEDRNYDVVYFNKDIPHDFASWVYGDSMEPDYPSGSVALIKDTGWDYDGAIYAVDWDGQSYIKKVYKEKDGLRLVSLNDKYDDKFAKWEEEPRIIGKVIGNFVPLDL